MIFHPRFDMTVNFKLPATVHSKLSMKVHLMPFHYKLVRIVYDSPLKIVFDKQTEKQEETEARTETGVEGWGAGEKIHAWDVPTEGNWWCGYS